MHFHFTPLFFPPTGMHTQIGTKQNFKNLKVDLMNENAGKWANPIKTWNIICHMKTFRVLLKKTKQENMKIEVSHWGGIYGI